MPKPSGDSPPKSALLLCPESPYPLQGGGPMRTASLLHYLAQRYTVDLVVFREPGAQPPEETIPSGLARRITTVALPFHSKTWRARATRNSLRAVRGVPPLVDRFAGFESEITQAIGSHVYDTAIVEHFWCAGYAAVLRPKTRKLVLDLHNIESSLLARSAHVNSGLRAAALNRFASSSRKLEQQLLGLYDLLLTTSETDSALVSIYAPTIVYPNTIPPVPLPHSKKVETIVFSGNLGYEPNIGAVRFFHTEIWPELRRRFPELRWRLLGKNPDAIRSIVAGDSTIEITGQVDDAIESLSKSRLAVVPLLAGSGTRIKIIEAWAAGLPVVSTSIGAEGLPGRHGEHWLIADSPVSFIEAVSSVLQSNELSARLSSAGRGLYERALTWTSAWLSLSSAGI